jgi:lipid-A-disaccharide synthase
LWPVFRDAATILRQRHPGVRVLVADAPAGPTNGAGDPASAPAEIVAAAADVALTKSGTTTLELALAGTPHVVAYRMHPLSWAVARATVRVPWVGLVNLILGRPAVPELLQDGATPAALAEAMETILSGPPAREQRAAFGEVVERLGTPGAARRVAELAIELVA